MSKIPDDLTLSRGTVLRIISLLGDPDRNDQECLMQATALRRTLTQAKGSDQSDFFSQNAPEAVRWSASKAV